MAKVAHGNPFFLSFLYKCLFFFFLILMLNFISSWYKFFFLLDVNAYFFSFLISMLNLFFLDINVKFYFFLILLLAYLLVITKLQKVHQWRTCVLSWWWVWDRHCSVTLVTSLCEYRLKIDRFYNDIELWLNKSFIHVILKTFFIREMLKRVV